MIRDFLAEETLHVDPTRVRVIAPDVGGGFGQKCMLYPEEAAVVWAARRTGAPVRWTATRSESFVADVHGRDQVTTNEIAFDEAATILALRADVVANLGAYVSMFGPPVAAFYGTPNISELYAIPAIHARIRGVYTNTTPLDAYRVIIKVDERGSSVELRENIGSLRIEYPPRFFLGVADDVSLQEKCVDGVCVAHEAENEDEQERYQRPTQSGRCAPGVTQLEVN